MNLKFDYVKYRAHLCRIMSPKKNYICHCHPLKFIRGGWAMGAPTSVNAFAY